ncbi:MAG TPA: RNA methyltransferase [Thermoleophilaceae bacterium]|nr:RNA methyltransferase [Thermoleophilaceae bacterium]
MITSADNDKLKTIRKLQQKRWRTKLGQFSAEGEDLVGPDPVFLLRAGEDVEPDLLDSVSTLGSGTRVIGVYQQRWAEPTGDLLVYLHRVEDPGNVGTIIRSAHALADATVVLGPGCADPYSPKAVRASMGSIFSHPPARAKLESLAGHRIALDANADAELRNVDVTAPVVLVLGSERGELPEGVEGVRIPVQADSLNVAMAASVALYEVANRMAADG